MPIYYIGRQRSLDYSSQTPIVQLISNPAVNGCQRCRYCYFCPETYEIWNTQDEYAACIKAHACGKESLFWTKMSNGTNPPLESPQDYTPTPLIRSIKVDLQSRYLQYFVIDITGYSCNSLCHYYPNRVATKQTVAACSSAHGCGRNGSFFRLLTILDNSIWDIPTWFNTVVPNGFAMIAASDDTIPLVHSVLQFDTAVPDAYVLKLLGSSSYYILNMIPGSIGCGGMLRSKRAGRADLMYWDPYGWELLQDGDPFVVVNSTECSLYQMLIDDGATDFFMLNGKPFLTCVESTTTAEFWTYDDYSMRTIKQVDDEKYVCMKYIGMTRVDYVKIMISTEKWLCLDSIWETSSSPSVWTTTKKAPADLSSSTFMVITSPFDLLADFLKNIGVKETIFK